MRTSLSRYVKEVPVQFVRYIAKQINADEESFASYGEREATKYEHLEEIRKVYSYQTFTLSSIVLCVSIFLAMQLQTAIPCT